MSHEYPTKEAYSAAEDRLLDMLSPRSFNATTADHEMLDAEVTPADEEDEDQNKITSPPSPEQSLSPPLHSKSLANRRRQSTRRHSVRTYGVHCPLDPSVDSEVHLISSESDTMSNISDEDFKGFSDVNDIDDEEDRSAAGVFGLQRRRTTLLTVDHDEAMDSVEGHDQENQLLVEELTSTSPDRQKNVEILSYKTFLAPHTTSDASPVSCPMPPIADQQLYAFGNNIIDIYTEQTSDYSTTEQQNSGDNEEACEIILNNPYTIQTFVANASQQCILYDNSAALDVENDDVCIVEVPYSPNAVEEVAVENNVSLQFAAAPNNLCIVNDGIGIHGGNHLALAQVAIGNIENEVMGNQNHQQTHGQCLITTDGSNMVNAQNLFYGVSDVSSDHDVIILTDEVVEPINEVYIDNIIDNADGQVLSTIDNEDDLCVDPYSDVTLENVDAIIDTTDAVDMSSEVVENVTEVLDDSEIVLQSQPDDNNLNRISANELSNLFAETNVCISAPRVEDQFLNMPNAPEVVNEYDGDAVDNDITETLDENVEKSAEQPLPDDEDNAMSVKSDGVIEECANEAVVVDTPAVVNTVVNVVCETPKTAVHKCSTSTTTEFPNSSNSNQLCSGDELHSFPQRTPMLKNTLSAEALDRKLATICQANPQPTIEEKIDSWNCNGEISEVEDVVSFDNRFVSREATRREQRADSTNAEIHDFLKFQEMMISNMQKLRESILDEQPRDMKDRSSMTNLQAKAQRMLQKRQATDTLSSSTADNQRFCTTYKHLLHAAGGGNSSSDITHKPVRLVQQTSSDATLVPMQSKQYIRKSSQPKATTMVTMDTQTLNDETDVAPPKENIATSTTDLIMQTNISACGRGGGGVYVPMSSNAFQLNTNPHEAYNKTSLTLPSSTYSGAAVVSMGYNYAIPPPPYAKETSTDVAQSIAEQLPMSSVNVPISMPPMTTADNNNEALFYQQHEFCNYLGLTGLATANAVAIAMQELANSSIARRSLRVRSQQQLERMRSDLSRNRKRTESKPSANARVVAGASSSDPPTTEVTSTTTAIQMPLVSSEETATKPTTSTKVANSELSDSGSLKIICKIPAKNAKENQKSAQLYDFFFNGGLEKSKHGQQQMYATHTHVRRKSAVEEFTAGTRVQRRTVSTESAISSTPLKNGESHVKQSRQSIIQIDTMRLGKFQNPNKTWSNQPTTEKLHEHIQQCLKKAREAKPAIYIVQAMNNEKTLKATQPSSQLLVPHPSLAALKKSSQTDEIFVNDFTKMSESTANKKEKPTATSIVSMSELNNDNRLLESTTSFKRPMRRLRTQNDSRTETAKQRKLKTTVRSRSKSSSQSNSRGLVTRMTTNMNSKQLRNRKISLMKSYYLVDETRGKRLSGGSTVAGIANAKAPKKNRIDQSTVNLAASSELSTTAREQTLNEGKRVASPTELNKVKAEAEVKKKKLTKATNLSGGRATAARAQVHGQQQESPKKNATTRLLARKKSSKSAMATSPTLEALTPKKTEGNKSPTHDKTHSENTNSRPEVVSSPKRNMDMTRQLDAHEFITNSSIVCPPAGNAATRRLMRSPILEENEPPSLLRYELPTPALRYPPASPTKQKYVNESTVDGRNKAGECEHAVASITRLTVASPAQRNPLVAKHGKVLYIYYEQDVLIVVQEKLVSFWKYSKIFSVLRRKLDDTRGTFAMDGSTVDDDNHSLKNSIRSSISNDESEGKTNEKRKQDWVHLGRARRITNDVEVNTPYPNRICVNNSTPLYLEMRCRQLEHNRREGKLLSTYVNVYYYSEEDLRPKMHSVHLDAVPGECSGIMYTTITDSRYFVMAWPQETMLGKVRTGLCKYSLTPTLDTLASIREFKNMKHAIRYIECLGEDKLIGYGTTRVTIWDHRSGDTIMCYDLSMDLGKNLGAMYYPSLDIGQSSMLVLYQHINNSNDTAELKIIACEVSCATPTHRVLQVHKLPAPEFNDDILSVNTGDHIILRSKANEEIWISGDDPQLLTFVTVPSTQRFYSRNRTQLVELGKKTLTVDSIANHMLKLASTNLSIGTAAGRK